MAENNNKNQAGQQKGVGRIPADGNEEQLEKKKDISFVDRQEGDMDNGELGGNFYKDGNNNDRDNENQDA